MLFNECKAVVLNKIDLQPLTDFDMAAFYASVKKLNADAPVFETSCRKGEGLEAWIAWLIDARKMAERM